MRVVWAPRAILRVTEAAQYIAADRPMAAGRWVKGVFAKVAALSRHPRQGHKVPEVNRDEIRQLRFGKYRVIYRIDPRRVVVLTLRHYARQWDSTELEP